MSRGTLSRSVLYEEPRPDRRSGPGERQRASSRSCHVLLEDSELFDAVPAHVRDQAFQDCIAQIITLAPGAWPAADVPSELCDGLGLLVLEGLVVSRVGIDGRFGAELLGGGDLLRPWQEAADALALPLTTARKVLTPTRIAVLDLAFAERAARYPQIAGQLVARTMNRSRNLAVMMAIAHHPRVDVRLHSLFWHLAGRWGRKRVDEVLLPLPLTHSVLADLIAARRPTVSSALADLSRRGVLTASAEGWRLTGSSPRARYPLPGLPASAAPGRGEPVMAG
jgi:CRP/FNR family cyclic AMP-dependent transcriptional regulator